MRHRKDLQKLGRRAHLRKATVQSLVRSLFLHDRVKTTVARAKAAQRTAERLLSRSKANDLAAHRYVYSYLGDHALVKRLFDEVRPRFEDRDSGFTRIFLMDTRLGDGAETAVLEMTVKGEQKKQESRAKAAKPQRPARPKTKPKTEKADKKETGEVKKPESAKKKPEKKTKSK